MKVSLLRCQLNETFGAGEVTTCAHLEAAQLLLNLIRLGVRAESCFEHGSQCACSLAWDKVLDFIEVITHGWSSKRCHHPSQLLCFWCTVRFEGCLNLMEPETWLLRSVVLRKLGIDGIVVR